MTGQPDCPEIPPEIYRLRYFCSTPEQDEDGPQFFIEVTSLEEWLRETAEDLEAQAEAKGLEDDELSAAGLFGAAHLLGSIADQITLLPLAHDLAEGDE